MKPQNDDEAKSSEFSPVSSQSKRKEQQSPNLSKSVRCKLCLAKNGRENQLSLLASHAFWGLIQCDDVLEESSDMTPGDRIPEWKGEELDISAYVLDIARMEEMKNLFPSAVANEQQVGANQEEFAVANEQQLGANQEEYAFANELQVGANQEENSTRMGVVSKNHDSEPSLENKADEQNEEASGDDSSPVERKPRVVWTKEMHRKFLEAIEILGPDNSFPKKIVELMNEPGLTRENVASHLQKYRMCLRKNQEEAANANSGRNPFFPLSEYSLQRYYHLNRESYSFNFQQAGSSSGIISTPPYLGMSNPFAPGSSTGISILKPTNLHQQQQSGLIKMQPYVNRHPMTSSSFRIYGDETRSMLLTTTDDHGSSSSNNSVSTTLNSQNFNSFIGLRFTGNGNLEFGQTSIISGNNEIEKTSTLSSASGTEILDQSYPLTPASYAPKPPNNEVNYDQLPSIFGDWTSKEDQAILALLTTPMEAETVTCEENVPDRTSLVIESNDREQFLPSGVPSFALGGTSGNGISVQESSSVSANEAAGCSLSPDMFWKHVYDDADIRHFH